MPRAPHSGPVALSAEDDRSVRELMTCAFADGGWTCRTAGTVAAALEQGHAAAQVTLLVTDVGVLRRDEADLVREMRRTHPGIGMLIVPGDANRIHDLQGSSRRSDAEILLMPFSIDDRLATAREVLLSTAGPAVVPTGADQDRRLLLNHLVQGIERGGE